MSAVLCACQSLQARKALITSGQISGVDRQPMHRRKRGTREEQQQPNTGRDRMEAVGGEWLLRRMHSCSRRRDADVDVDSGSDRETETRTHTGSTSICRGSRTALS